MLSLGVDEVGKLNHQPQTLLGIDYGRRFVGVAVGNTLTHTSTPLVRIAAGNAETCLREIGNLIDQWHPATVVVGMPSYPDGKPHPIARRARKFARTISERFGVHIELTDEGYSSVEAARYADSESIDAEAAAIILQQYLNTTISTKQRRDDYDDG